MFFLIDNGALFAGKYKITQIPNRFYCSQSGVTPLKCNADMVI